MYTALNCKTHYSIRQSIMRPDQLKGRTDLVNVCMADNGHVCGAVQWKKSLPNGLIGISVTTIIDEKMILIAKNKKGWKNILKISSIINTKDNKGKIRKQDLIDLLNDDLIVIYMYPENKPVPNSWYGIDINNDDHQLVRETADRKNLKSVMAHEAWYVNSVDKIDMAIVLSISYNKPVNIILREFLNKKRHILSYTEAIESGYTDAEIKNTNIISDICSSFTPLSNPVLPKFECPDELQSSEYLQILCEQKSPDSEIYRTRLHEELKIIEKYQLQDYFLIVRDIINYTNSKHGYSGIRGSGVGSIISYLSGISQVDPIKYNLVFERFLNEGRFSGGHIQLPDIDIDVPAEARADVINYVKEKYGHDRVGQILTYQRIKAAAAVKAVFKANTSLDYQEINHISSILPQESKIVDKIKEENLDSVIEWALIHNSGNFKQWGYIEDGEIKGEYKQCFEQAIRLEGINSARSRHAAGIIVSPEPLINICPLIYDENSKTEICGMEMNDLEALGCLKLDILGLRLFDKMLEFYHDVC